MGPESPAYTQYYKILVQPCLARKSRLNSLYSLYPRTNLHVKSRLPSSCLDKLGPRCLFLHLFPLLASLFILRVPLFHMQAYTKSYRVHNAIYCFKVNKIWGRKGTSEPCDKNPLMKPKDLYPPNAGIWKTTREINFVTYIAYRLCLTYQDSQKAV